MKVNEPSEPWPCDWEGAELYQLRRGASRSFRENLIWLEEATEFAEKFSKAPWHKEGIKPASRQERVASLKRDTVGVRDEEIVASKRGTPQLSKDRL